ncbi:MAG: DUF6265 family protein [Pseudomonadota bacterium]
MRTIATLAAALAASCTHGDAPNPSAPGPFGWLEGCWVTQSGASEEVWAAAGESLLIGYNTVSRDGEVVFFEQLRIEETQEGWVFFAYPRGRGPTPFALAEQGESSASFANPDHDFPQVLRYSREGDTLTAVASLTSGERAQGWVYTPCGG